MEGSPMFAPWSTFYGAVAQAAATLIGLLFVIVTLGSSLGARFQETARVFLTPTLVHFAAVFFVALVTLAPNGSRVAIVACVLLCGALGFAYITAVARRASATGLLDRSDRWARAAYAPLPATAYLLLVAGSLAAFAGWREASLPVAVATATLLAIGIRNAWAMALFAVERSARKPDEPRP
jgi:hypothetical protein